VASREAGRGGRYCDGGELHTTHGSAVCVPGRELSGGRRWGWKGGGEAERWRRTRRKTVLLYNGERRPGQAGGFRQMSSRGATKGQRVVPGGVALERDALAGPRTEKEMVSVRLRINSGKCAVL